MAMLGLKLFKLKDLASEYDAPAKVDRDTSKQRVGCSCAAVPSLPVIRKVSRAGRLPISNLRPP
jgi:hypothetical protein